MDNATWTSDPMKIGRHEWRVGVFQHKTYGPCTFYEWRPVECSQSWKLDKEWPSYDSNDTHDGLPRSLARLWERERATIDFYLYGEQAQQEFALTP